MTSLIGLSGSLRRRSYNTGLLRAAGAQLPDGVTLDIADISQIPLYNGDLEEADGIPPSVTALKDAIAAADGLVLATPEYNNGIPGVFKNVLDWCSRPASDIPRVFAGKPVAIIGASPGGFGTILAQNAWLPVLRALRLELWSGGKVMVSGAAKAFDAEGTLIDPAVATQLKAFLNDFAKVVSERTKPDR